MSYRDHVDTPLGRMEVCAGDSGITSLNFVEETSSVNSSSITDEAIRQINQYFDGERRTFNIALDATGTDFQQGVWQALCAIDYGQTCSYQDIAEAIENPKAVRAVGAANGKNPISIIVPCHRVIGANGALTGYASGVDRKAWLLKHEGSLLF